MTSPRAEFQAKMSVEPIDARCRAAAGPYSRRSKLRDIRIADIMWRRTRPEPNTGCHIWIGTVSTSTGYGTFSLRRTTFLAHRIAFELANGPIPRGLVCDHICRVRSCVNPDHLRLVTRSQNSTENSESPAARNKAKAVCSKCGGPFTPILSAKKGWIRKCGACMLAAGRRHDRQRRITPERAAYMRNYGKMWMRKRRAQKGQSDA